MSQTLLTLFSQGKDFECSRPEVCCSLTHNNSAIRKVLFYLFAAYHTEELIFVYTFQVQCIDQNIHQVKNKFCQPLKRQNFKLFLLLVQTDFNLFSRETAKLRKKEITVMKTNENFFVLISNKFNILKGLAKTELDSSKNINSMTVWQCGERRRVKNLKWKLFKWNIFCTKSHNVAK